MHRLRPALLLLVVLAVVASSGSASPLAPAGASPAARAVNDLHVIAISVDGLNPRALKKLGRSGAPNLFALIKDEGAGTTNARSQRELTLTLPNHTSMVTGVRIKASRGGHGVTWNDDTVRTTVQQAAGREVASVFTEVHAAGGTTGVFSTKLKFDLFERSWPDAVDATVISEEKDASVVRAFRQDLATSPNSFSLLHLGKADEVGHHRGWLSPRYLRAVARLDKLIGTVLTQVRASALLRARTVVVLTSDHGGIPGSTRHSRKRDRENYRVPFAVWGAGVDRASLYALNPQRARPGKRRPGYGATVQPIRNSEVANLSLDLLGLPPVPGSQADLAQDLTWR